MTIARRLPVLSEPIRRSRLELLHETYYMLDIYLRPAYKYLTYIIALMEEPGNKWSVLRTL